MFLRRAHGSHTKVMPFTAAALVFLIPLILTPHLLFYYDITPKVALLLLGAILALVALPWELRSWSAFARTRWGGWYLGSLAATLAIAAISAWRSAEPNLAWYGSNWRRLGVFPFAAVLLAAAWAAQCALRSRRTLLLLLRATCAAGLVAALYGIAQYLGWDPLLPRDSYAVGEGVFQIIRPPGTLGHSDYFAAFLLWPVFAGWALRPEEKSLWRWIGLATAASGSVAIVLSGSRGALLGLVCGVAVRILLRPVAYRRAAAGLLIAAIGFAAFYLSPAGERLRARVHWIQEDPVGGARLLLWRDSLAMAVKRPVAGYGPESFSTEFPQFESVALARAYPDFYHESPHNLFFDVLTSQGTLGLLALLASIGFAFAGALRAKSANPLVAVAFLPGLAATLAAHQFVVWTAPGSFFFYLGAGVLAGADRREALSELKMALPWRSVAAVAGFAGAVLIGLLAYRMVAEDASLATVQRRLDSGDLTGAAQTYRAALSRPDAGVTADLYFSRRWSKIAMESSAAIAKIYYSQVAAGAATRATRQREQLANAWFNLSVLTGARSDASGTEYALRQAESAAPNWYKPHWILARLLGLEGRFADASDEANRAIDLDAGKDAEVAATMGNLLRSIAARQ